MKKYFRSMSDISVNALLEMKKTFRIGKVIQESVAKEDKACYEQIVTHVQWRKRKSRLDCF